MNDPQDSKIYDAYSSVIRYVLSYPEHPTKSLIDDESLEEIKCVVSRIVDEQLNLDDTNYLTSLGDDLLDIRKSIWSNFAEYMIDKLKTD